MSILSSLALLVTGVAAKLFDVTPDIEVTRLKEQIDDLERERDVMRAIIEQWRRREQASLLQASAAFNGIMLGAQALTFEGFCNCVPARHDMFLNG